VRTRAVADLHDRPLDELRNRDHEVEQLIVGCIKRKPGLPELGLGAADEVAGLEPKLL
jgi:hypothetical protein